MQRRAGRSTERPRNVLLSALDAREYSQLLEDSDMLGVRRAGVTVAAGMLQKAGLIEYKYGRITVVDREGLEAASCACYGIIRATYDRLAVPELR